MPSRKVDLLRFLQVALTLAAMAAQAPAQTYILTPLGGPEVSSGFQPIQINDSGQVIGHGFFWESSNRNTSDLNTLIGDVGTAAGINNAGQFALQLSRVGFIQGAIWDSSSGFTNISPPEGVAFSVPSNINNTGEVVGFSESIAGRSAFYFDGNETLNLGSLPQHSVSTATDINDSSVVVGVSGFDTDSEAFIWDTTNGMVAIDVGSLPVPNAINNLGQVVGRNSSGAFVWDSTNGRTELGTTLGPTSVATDVNETGQVVGESSAGAFVWDTENGIVNLNTRLTPSADGWALNSALSINSAGDIVGWGLAPNSLGRGFLLTAARGDFTDDRLHNCADINALVEEIAAGTNDLTFDVNGDGAVDMADRDAWLAEAGAATNGPDSVFLVGDVDFSGAVDSTDLGRLLNEFGTESEATYCGGDLNADSHVDSSDLGLLLNQFGSQIAIVPEPDALGLLALSAFLAKLGLMRRRRRR